MRHPIYSYWHRNPGSQGTNEGVPGGGDSPYFTTNAINITPTIGPTEIITNGTFTAWTAGNPDGWTVVGEVGADPEVSEVAPGNTHGGGGNGAANFYSSITNNAPAPQQLALTAQTWYQISLNITARIAGTIRPSDTAGGLLAEFSTTGVKVYTGRAAGATFRLLARNAPSDFTVDDVSAMVLGATEQLFTHSLPYGDFSVTPTVAVNYQGGVTFNYSDSNNWLRLYLDRLDGRAYLIKRVGGSTSVISSWAFTYVAGTKLTARRYADGTMDIIYGTTTLASGVASAGLTGKQAGPFLTSASQVTIGAYTWDARGF